MGWLSFFGWFCLMCGVLSVVCIVIGYPALGSMGLVTFGWLGVAEHRLTRRSGGGGDAAGVRVPVGRGPSAGPAAQAADPPEADE